MKLTASLLAFLFILTPLSPIFALPAPTESLESFESDLITPRNENMDAAPNRPPLINDDDTTNIRPLPVTATPAIIAPEKEAVAGETKFKKNNALSVEEQLALVRQHLLNNNFPPTFLNRLETFETEQKKNLNQNAVLKKVSDFLASNQDEQKETKEAIEFGKRSPFRVETFQ